MNYTVQELIHDPSFRRMAKGQASEEEISKWSRWIEASEAHRRKARQASMEVVGFGLRQDALPDLDSQWERLQEYISEHKKNRSNKNHGRGRKIAWIYRVAAILAVASMVGMAVYWYAGNQKISQQQAKITQRKTLRTGPREQNTIQFERGSEIILHGNSSLTYELSPSNDSTIHVELHGKAYFTTNTIDGKSSRTFIVRTPSGVVRDIGTTFSVATQQHRTQVVLQEGKLQVHPNDQKSKDSIVAVEPGEQLTFNRSKIIDKKRVNPTFYTSWATGFIRFDHSSVGELADFISKRFNKDVQFKDRSLANITLEGSAHFKTLPGLLRSVSTTAGVAIYPSKNKDTIFIGGAPPHANASIQK